MERLARALLVGGWLGGLGFGCVSDHDALAKRPDQGGSGGALDAGSDAEDASSDGDGSAGSDGSLADAGKDAFVEPSGQSELTLLHGVVDAETIAFCFARVTASGLEFAADPIPKQGLAYGRAASLSSIGGIDLSKDDVEVHVVSASSTLIAAGDCASLTAGVADPDGGDPKVRSRALALVPAATFSGGYSDLIVAAGCLGAPSHTDPIDNTVCGSGYSPETPTLTPLVVQLSRVTDPAKLGLQVVHASVPSQEIDVRSVPPENTPYSPLYVAGGVVTGAIVPRPPNLSFGVEKYGIPLTSSSLEVTVSQSSTEVAFSWGVVLAQSGVAELFNGETYALVLLGPRLGVAQAAWWNPPAIALIPTDPET